MSQIEGKIVKMLGSVWHLPTDLRIILSNFVVTDVYAFFKKSFKTISNLHVQNEGGEGPKAVWTMLKKTAPLANVGFP